MRMDSMTQPARATSVAAPTPAAEPAKPPTQILVIPRRQMSIRLGNFRGFVRASASTLSALVANSPAEFQDRPTMEKDPSFKQIIPYVVLTGPFRADADYQVFAYRRTPKGGESRLHGKRSVGIGGHIEQDPTADPRDVSLITREMRRELAEEVGFTSLEKIDFVGWLNDDGDDVGRVHLGAVHHVMVTEPDSIGSTEEDVADDGFHSLSALLADFAQFETWSQLILLHLAEFCGVPIPASL